jgi:hypothetical protein
MKFYAFKRIGDALVLVLILVFVFVFMSVSVFGSSCLCHQGGSRGGKRAPVHFISE